MSEDMEALYEASFTLIGIAGDSKAESMQAIDCCKQGDFEGARKHLAAADETMVKAHDAQTEMLQQEAEGNPVPVQVMRDMAEQFMDLYQTVQTLKESK
mgnify:CR=1 FL=1